jgi:uncharacterized membrane protein (UPF0182 family)
MGTINKTISQCCKNLLALRSFMGVLPSLVRQVLDVIEIINELLHYKLDIFSILLNAAIKGY